MITLMPSDTGFQRRKAQLPLASPRASTRLVEAAHKLVDSHQRLEGSHPSLPSSPDGHPLSSFSPRPGSLPYVLLPWLWATAYIVLCALAVTGALCLMR